MRKSSWTPSIVPKWQDQTIYLVLDNFGRQGRAWCETDTERTDLESVISDLMTGQYKDPVAVAAFNLEERWSGDVSEDIAHEIQRRNNPTRGEIPPSVEDFVERHAGPERQLVLRLA